MYTLLKKVAKFLLPHSLVQSHGQKFRKFYSWRYRGSKHQCNICSFNLKSFLVLKNGDLLCPNCGSLPRSRKLYQILQEQNLDGKRVLHFSPPAALCDELKKNNLANYITTDFENEFAADYQYDITILELPKDSFDLIICYHVLEHISDDITAMKELKRVLKFGGLCLIQTPFKEGDIYEDPSIDTDIGRLKSFGQKDHYRIYSPSGLITRLEAIGFKANLKKYYSDQKNYHGLKEKDLIIFAKC